MYVGAAAAVVLVVSLSFVFLRRRRAGKKAAGSDEPEVVDAGPLPVPNALSERARLRAPGPKKVRFAQDAELDEGAPGGQEELPEGQTPPPAALPAFDDVPRIKIAAEHTL